MTSKLDLVYTLWMDSMWTELSL